MRCASPAGADYTSATVLMLRLEDFFFATSSPAVLI